MDDIYENALNRIREAKRNRPNYCVVIGPTGPTDTYKSVSEYF